MKRVLIAIGCDAYDYLPALHGAESDAVAIKDTLAEPKGDYDAASSVLLLSPSVDEIIGALSSLPFGADDIESLTFFFAGHGGTKSGTYYLCARNTHPARLSTTGLAVTRLLSVIAEVKPLQANVLIDACQSGSAMLDSAALLRADALGLGNPGSLSIAFLAACALDEYASETSTGGELTQSVLSYVRGDETLQTTRPALDLIDLGRRVSASLSEKLPDQVPVSWGMNLTGEGRFARNPHFAPSTKELAQAASALSSASLGDETRQALQSHAFALWREHRELEHETNITSLRKALGDLVSDLKGDKPAIAQVLRGLATSLRASAVSSADVFAESLVLYACAEPLLSILDDTSVAAIAQQLLEEAAYAQAQARRWLLKALNEDQFALLSDGNALADLYFLPLRLSRILGWLAVGIELGRLSGRPDPTADKEVEEIAQLVLRNYAPSLVARSDAQASFVLAFVEATRRRGWVELAEQVIGCYFTGFVQTEGVIARPDLSGEDAFSFTVGLGNGPEHVEHRLRANPTQFASVLLICGTQLDLDNEWDPDLIHLDHHAGYVFVPDSFADFGAKSVEQGQNFGFQIGQDIWTLGDFRAFMQSKIAVALQSATRDLSPLGASLALVASCLQPDRLPLHILDSLEPRP
jgi:hypothetical protein